MSIEGRIAVDVSFADSATSSGVQAIKKISLVDSTAYTTGKVAIVTGTVGTAVVTVTVAPTSYKNAQGEVVSFSALSRFAISATGAPVQAGQDYVTVQCSTGRPAISDGNNANDSMNVYTTAGTASYTLVLYGT